MVRSMTKKTQKTWSLLLDEVSYGVQNAWNRDVYRKRVVCLLFTDCIQRVQCWDEVQCVHGGVPEIPPCVPLLLHGEVSRPCPVVPVPPGIHTQRGHQLHWYSITCLFFSSSFWVWDHILLILLHFLNLWHAVLVLLLFLNLLPQIVSHLFYVCDIITFCLCNVHIYMYIAVSQFHLSFYIFNIVV